MLSFHETLNAQRCNAVYRWAALVEEATAGRVTASYDETHGMHLGRSDGGVIDTYESFGETHDITGVLTGIHPWRVIDKRHKTDLRELRDAVRSFIVKYGLLADRKVLNAFCHFEYVYKIAY